jgi:MFS transporter, Spinster family, sphingosine-1-phosphate transporter
MHAQRSGYTLLAALTALNVLNFADRFLLVSFANSIIADLGLTKFQFTLLTGLVFSVFYVLFGLLAGSLADRYDRPRLIAAGLALWSALTAATGLAVNFAQAALARVFIGVGEAVLTPSAMSMLSDRLPPQRHGLAAGVYYLGIPIGIGSSFIFSGLMGPVLGWRGTFIALGLVGLCATALVLLLRDPPRGGGGALGPEGQRIGSGRDSAAGLWRVLRTNPVLGLTLVGGAAAIFVQGVAVLDIVWWVQERGYTESRAQQLTGLLFLTGGITGALFGGIGADAMYRRGKGGRLMFLAICYVLVIPIGIGYRFSEANSFLFYACAFIGSASFMMPYGTTFSTVQEVVPVNLRGAAVALLVLFNTLVGHAAGAALAGHLADSFAESGMEQPLTWAAVLASIPGLLTIPAFAWAARLHARPTEPEKLSA